MKMGMYLKRTLFIAVVMVVLLGFVPKMSLASEVSLNRSGVVVDVGEASYVHYTVNELRRQIEAITGSSPVLYYDLQQAQHASGPLVIVGRAMASRLAREEAGAPKITDEDPGVQGFVLRAVRLQSGKEAIVAAGSDSEGTNYAVMELRQLLAESHSGLGVSASLDLREKPRYKIRALYLHQHWRYKNPYATWSWSVEDWKRALDMAAYLRVNLVMMWVHMDMMAPPLSIPERDYLANIREVIDYAHRERGMKIWMIEPANVLLNSPAVKRLPMDQRDYYAYANMGMGGLQNPGDPKGYAALMANRKAFYQAVPNADGYGYIDSDPGGWLGSPSSAFVKLFEGNRELLEKYHQGPQPATLVYWVWGSWGTGSVEENWRNTMQGFERTSSGPKELLLGWAPHVTLAQEFGYLKDSVFFPYGVIEGEPTFPLTAINFGMIGRAFDYASRYPGLQGVMANAQTFLIQLPNIYYFMHSAWSGENAKGSDVTVLRPLAKLLFPEKADLLAEGWAELAGQGSAPALAAAERIEVLLKNCRPERLGTLGGYVFPRSTQVLSDLVTSLEIHASAERARETVAAGDSESEVTEAMEEYFRRMLDWQKTNGFFGAYGAGKKVAFDNFIHGQDAKTVETAWKQFCKQKGDPNQLEAEIVRNISEDGYTEWIVRAMTGELFGTERQGEGDTNPIFRKLPPNKVLLPWLEP